MERLGAEEAALEAVVKKRRTEQGGAVAVPAVSSRANGRLANVSMHYRGGLRIPTFHKPLMQLCVTAVPITIYDHCTTALTPPPPPPPPPPPRPTSPVVASKSSLARKKQVGHARGCGIWWWGEG